MPLGSLASWLPFPQSSTPAKVPVDPADVSVLQLRLEEAKAAGGLTLDVVHLISLQHQIGMAKKAKANAEAAKKRAAVEARAAADAKKAALQQKSQAVGETDRQLASQGVAAAVDRFELAVADMLHASRQKKAAESHGRALERTAGLARPTDKSRGTCVSSPSVID